MVFKISSRNVRLIWAVVIVAVITGTVLVSRWYWKARREIADAHARSRLAQISLSIRNYHAVHNVMPPLSFSAGSGQPMQSWRILSALDFAEHNRLDYDRTLPWSAVENRAVARTFNEYGIFSTGTYSGDKTTVSQVLAITDSAAWAEGAGNESWDVPALFFWPCSTVEVFEPRDVKTKDVREIVAEDSPDRQKFYVATIGGKITSLSRGNFNEVFSRKVDPRP